MAVFDERDFAVPVSERAGAWVNYAGAAVSLALMAGVGVWGYKLIVRDVSGIPVVQAMEGAMRITPDNPGGELAVHTGLAVNAVPAEGEAAGFEDTLVLAPQTQDLAEEDLNVTPLAEAGEVVPQGVDESTQTPVALSEAEIDQSAAPMTAEEILALADQIATGAAPLTELAEGEDVAPTVALDGEVVVSVDRIPASVPGVVQSLRPPMRPATLVRASAPAPAQVVDTATAINAALEAAISTEALPAGTKLVQLGAFPSAEVAAEAWTRMEGRFGDILTGKERIIQVATSGGRTFYRLRAGGFGDLAAAERFCAALEAGEADCIPVVIR